MAEMIMDIRIDISSGKLIFSGEFSIDELMQLLRKNSSSDPEAEIMNLEDMPGPDKKCDAEELRQLRERLKIDAMIEKEDALKNFVELVFHELCQRDADFRRIMTEKAFEEICSVVYRYLQQFEVTKKASICEYINTVFDNIEAGSKFEKYIYGKINHIEGR